jgi:ADP-glucose pyrophosphorylase
MDVGRPHDLLEANLAVAESEYRLKVFDSAVECCTKDQFYLGPGASIANSTTSKTVISKGSNVKDSVLSRVLLLNDCKVEGAKITDSILGDGCVVKKGAEISNAVLADNTVVEEGQRIEGDRIV